MVWLPKDEQFTGPLVAELLRFPNGVHDDQVDALAWLGLMMTEFATYQAPVVHVASWRDRLPFLGKERTKQISYGRLTMKKTSTTHPREGAADC